MGTEQNYHQNAQNSVLHIKIFTVCVIILHIQNGINSAEPNQENNMFTLYRKILKWYAEKFCDFLHMNCINFNSETTFLRRITWVFFSYVFVVNIMLIDIDLDVEPNNWIARWKNFW